MFISPKTAIEKGWIKRADGQEIAVGNIQPNAIDFTIDRVFALGGNSFKAVDAMVDGQLKTIKELPDGVELEAVEDADPKFDRVPLWKLDGRASFDFTSDFYVDLPEGVAAMLIVRSTFNRGSLFVTSGLYDSGYKGAIGGAIHNNGQLPAYVGKGVRVGQIMFVQSDSAGMYAGGYNHEAGDIWRTNVQ